MPKAIRDLSELGEKERKAILRDWLDRLERDEDQQVQGVLRRTDQPSCFCALGLLCDELVRRDFGVWHSDGPGSILHSWVSGVPTGDVEEIAGELGIRTSVVELVVDMNDNGHLSFPEIADALRSRLKH